MFLCWQSFFVSDLKYLFQDVHNSREDYECVSLILIAFCEHFKFFGVIMNLIHISGIFKGGSLIPFPIFRT